MSTKPALQHNDKSIQKQLSLVGVTAGSIHDLVYVFPQGVSPALADALF